MRASMKYIAALFLLVGIFAYIIDQTIYEGLYYKSEQEYQLDAANLAYNQAIAKQQDMAAKQKLSVLNNVQMYDFLARSQQVQEPSLLGRAVVTANNQFNVMPVEQEKAQFLTKENAVCRLLEQKQRHGIPDGQAVYELYQHQFDNGLKLSLTKDQLKTIWQSMHCAK